MNTSLRGGIGGVERNMVKKALHFSVPKLSGSRGALVALLDIPRLGPRQTSALIADIGICRVAGVFAITALIFAAEFAPARLDLRSDSDDVIRPFAGKRIKESRCARAHPRLDFIVAGAAGNAIRHLVFGPAWFYSFHACFPPG